MADKKISELNSAAAVYDADDFALVQDGDTKQVNASAVKAYVKDGLSKSDVGLGNVDNTSDANKPVSTATQTALDLKQDAASAATLTGTQTLTNKTISGSSNTLSNIGNSSLTNSSITINGNAVSLGGSTTVSAATTNTLTIGTGLSGTSFNGSAATTIAIDSTVVTMTGTQTLTNKTLTSPVISGGTANNVAIGGTTPAAGAFTTLSSTGNTTLGDASTDTVTVNGYMGVGGAADASFGLLIQSTNLLNANQIGFDSAPTGTSAATTSIIGAIVAPKTAAATFTCADVIGLRANNAVKGAGSTITNQTGLKVLDQTQGTNNYGITSEVTSGANKWNIYASGTAANYFAGSVGVGTTLFASNGKVQIQNVNDATTDAGLRITDGSSINLRLGNTSTTTSALWSNRALLFGTGNNSFTEKMRIDSSGNLGLGVTPSAWYSSLKVLQVGTGSMYSTTTTQNTLFSANEYVDSSANPKYIVSDYASRYQQFIGQHRWYTAPSGTAGSAISFTQAMTLDASGNLLVGGTNSSTPGGIIQATSTLAGAQCFGAWNKATSGNAYLFYGGTGASFTARYQIYWDFTSGTGTAGFISDYRQKDNVRRIASGLNTVNALIPSIYRFKGATEDASGFIAHEVQSVIPQAVSGHKDEVDDAGNPRYQMLDQTHIIPYLTAAIQELHAEIELLKAKVN